MILLVEPELGRLLRTLAAGRWRIAEIGAGDATPWLEQALPPGAALVSAPPESWEERLIPQAPFDLLFFDGAGEDRARVVELIAPGGLVVARPHAFWLEHPGLFAVEALGVVVAARQPRAAAIS